MSSGTRTDPYLDCRFAVEIESLIVAGFSDVSGLEVEIETEEYEEGGRTNYTHEFPGQTSHPNLELRRGLTDSHTFINWVQDVTEGRIERKTVYIFLLDTQGESKVGWECAEAYPVRYAGPELQADQGAVAMETVELTHKGLSEMELRR